MNIPNPVFYAGRFLLVFFEVKRDEGQFRIEQRLTIPFKEQQAAEEYLKNAKEKWRIDNKDFLYTTIIDLKESEF